MAQTSMLHVRVDDEIKSIAAEKLANFGLTLSDAVRILLTWITKEGGLPAGLTTDPETYNTWFKAKIQEALDDPRPDHSLGKKTSGALNDLENLIYESGDVA